MEDAAITAELERVAFVGGDPAAEEEAACEAYCGGALLELEGVVVAEDAIAAEDDDGFAKCEEIDGAGLVDTGTPAEGETRGGEGETELDGVVLIE